jgi:DNA processing protein
VSALSDRSARMALTQVVDAGDPVVARLVADVGPQAAWFKICEGVLGEPLARRAASVGHHRGIRLAEHYHVRFVVPGDDEWPASLDDLRFAEPIRRRGGAPIGLWLRGPGHLARLMGRSVAVVGSRAATSYGTGVATDLGAELAERGVTVVSGGAYGIDAAAHRGALSAGGPTVAFVANGVDVAYPKGNTALFDRLAADHLLVSELPPGEPPSRVRFLARNRLIAAGSQGTVVVEAAVRSGARNTAGWALECNRHLMAVPGPVYSSTSAGPHLMIRSGQADLICCADDVLELVGALGMQRVRDPRGSERTTDDMDENRLAVYEALPARAYASVGDLAMRAGLAVPICLAELAGLEAAGLAEGDERGWRATRVASQAGDP